MAGKKDIVEQALKLVMGGSEKAAPKIIGTDAAGRPMLDFRGAVVSHFTDPESAADIWSHGYRQVGDGYYGRAVSFTPNREYGRQFGGVETNAVVSPDANILDSANPAHSEIIQRVLNDRSLAPVNPRPGQKTWDQKFRELGYDGLYDPGAGDLFIYNPSKVKPIVPEKSSGGSVAKGNGGATDDAANITGKNDPYADEVASAKRLLAEKAYDEQPWSEWAGDVVGNAVNTARSILPTALGGRGEVGLSDMARGAYEAGKDAVTFPGDVITGKQALFDEAGRPLEQAVGRSFNTAATMGGASSVVPVPDNSLRIFGGVRSRTADKNALTKAQIMESQGASPDEIWKQTGWGRGAEQQWRYDIPDTDAAIRPYNLKDKTSKSGDVYKSATLAELLDHPEFFEAYPEFKTMLVNETFDPGVNGYYLPRFDRGTINPGFSDPFIALNLKNLPQDENKLSTLLHEVQHAVQQKEGFAPGSNPRNYPDQTPNPMVAVYEKAFWNDPDLKFIRSTLDTADYFDALAGSNKLYNEEFEPLHKQLLKDEESGIDTIGKYGLITEMAEKASYEKFPILKQIDDAYKALRKKGIPHKRPKEFLEPTEAYRATAGEVEARNVQERMNMSRDELKELAPWQTQESYLPYEGQIIDWNDTSWRKGYAAGGEVDDDIDDALRIAKDVGGSTPVMMEDAKGNKYDAQGQIIPPQNPGPQPARSDVTPQQVGRQAAQDPATYDALMERYAIPDRDIAEYEATRSRVAQQPQATQQMTHVGDRPRREMKIDMPLFGGEYSMGTAPYDVAEGLQGMAQTAYDFKTMPAYFFPPTAPFALGADVLESRIKDDPLGLALNLALTPQGFSAAKSAVNLARRNSKTTAAAVGAGAYLTPDEAEAGPERWFSKLFRAAEALPMEKMTGEQALAMLRKTAPQEEIRWTGLEGFASDNPVTTKKALLDFIQRNQVKTQDVVLGGSKPLRRDEVAPSETAIAPYKERWGELVAKNRAINDAMLLPPNQRDADIDDLLAQRNDIQYEMDQIHDKAVDATIEEMGGLGRPVGFGPGSQYGEKYVTPGGEGYQETLVTLPPEKKILEEYPVFDEYGQVYGNYTSAEKAQSIVNARRGLRLGTPRKTEINTGFRSRHWSEPNVVGHIRTQMLTANPPGANRPLRLFNVDEAQSDWGKAGRDKGFVTAEDKASFPMLVKQYDELAKQRRDLERLIGNGDDTTPEITAATKQAIEINRQMMALSDKMSSIRSGGVSAAPYVTSTQNWTDLSIKKSLDQAIDSGADYFTFTPGEVQAKRYSLRNEVQGLAYDPEEKTLSFYPKDGRGWQDVRETIPPEDLKKYIGEEASKKLLAQEPNSLSGNQILEGIDLEFGGEGMIDYYNNIYKKRVEKVVKDLTGKKVQWEVLPAETSEGIVPRLGFRIDDDLKEAKFPTFASGGIVSRALELTRDY